MQHLQIALLGSPSIKLNGAVVDTDRRKAIGLLAYLAVEDKAYSRETLAALLWPDYPRASAFAYLRRTLWEINQMVGTGWVEADRENVRLVRTPGLEIDIESFKLLENRPTNKEEALSEAASLYRGDFLEGLVVADTAPFEEWQSLQAESYRRNLAHVLEELIAIYEGKGAFEQALPYAQRWLAIDQLDENAWRSVMRQFAGMGDRNGAIRAYQRASETLKEELGVMPQPETEELYQAILRGELHPKESKKIVKAEVATSKLTEGNLPIPITPFIGRAEEIRQITRLALDPQVHLLTLTGPGGTGKTRLSIQVAAGMDGSFSDGVWFIPLAAVQSTQGIITAIAEGFNFSFYKGEESPRQQLLDYLREKKLILVLDNFEHLIDAGRELVLDILKAASGVKLLITSRERLNLLPEQVYRVHGMKIPDQVSLSDWSHPKEQVEMYSGIQLLQERARRAKPDFQITRENIKPVMEICQLVDGSPLGIELAASWLEVLTEEDIAIEIAHNLDFLESNAADTPERQRSLRTVFDTSWRLLGPEEQQAFRRLCVFRGSFSRAAAQDVSGASLHTLLNLANKSWLQQSDSGRYQLHEVLKQYGIEHLKADQGEWRETKDRQAEFFIKFVEVNGQALHTAQQIQALKELKPELDNNIPDTWQWVVSQGRVDALINSMLPGIFNYWLIRGVSMNYFPLIIEARQALPASSSHNTLVQAVILEALALTVELNLFVMEDRPKERLEQLWAKVHAGNLMDEMGFWYVVLVATYGSIINYQEGSRRIGEVLRKIDKEEDTWFVGNCYLLAGLFAEHSEMEIRRTYLLRALGIFKKIGVVKELGTTLQSLGGSAAAMMDYEQAIEYNNAAQAIFEQVGDAGGIDTTWTNLGECYIYLGRIGQALHAFEELRHYSERMGNRRMLGTDLSWESLQVSRYGNLELALELRQRSLQIAHEISNQHDVAWFSWELGEIYRLMGKIDLAKKYYQEARPGFESMQELIGMGFYYRGLGDIATGQRNWQEARKQYVEALNFHEKEQRSNRNWGLALTHARLGSVLIQLGELDAAKQHLRASLALAVIWTNPDLKSLPLTGIAEWLLANGQYEKALELAACVASKPTTWNEVKKQAGVVLAEAKTALPSEQAERWVESGRKIQIDEACTKYSLAGNF
jgi:predicted ATPase/DNA-binding SARP family transcriptional activator